MFSHRALPPAGDDTVNKEGVTTAEGQTTLSPQRRHRLLSCLSLFGLMSLCYLLGALVIFFDLPTSSFLRRAFVGGMAWSEKRQGSQPPEGQLPPLTVGQIDKPDKTWDGFTLCMYGGDSQAKLVNMHGKVVHQWHVPFSKVWSSPPHLRGRIEDAKVYFNDGHIYPNGDLLVVIEGPADFSYGGLQRNPSNGYGLAKLDKDSHIIWKYPRHCHHDVDVGEDGTIYVLTNEVVDKVPSGLEYIPTPCMIDLVDVLSPEGKKLKTISLLEALQDTPYAPLLCILERSESMGSTGRGMMMSGFADDMRRRDVLHANAIKVLHSALAPKFPLFKPGHLLLSLRHLDALVVLDPDSGKVVWAARGPWRAQHDPTFLDNGHILLFDNLGSPRGSRVLEYNPRTQGFPWLYPGENGTPFLSRIRGMCQRLPNGNTLIVNSDAGEVFEVTAGREVVWSCSCGHVELYRARRYGPDQLPFLKGDPRARP